MKRCEEDAMWMMRRIGGPAQALVPRLHPTRRSITSHLPGYHKVITQLSPERHTGITSSRPRYPPRACAHRLLEAAATARGCFHPRVPACDVAIVLRERSVCTFCPPCIPCDGDGAASLGRNHRGPLWRRCIPLPRNPQLALRCGFGRARPARVLGPQDLLVAR